MENLLEFYRLYSEALWLTVILIVTVMIMAISVYDIFTWKAIEFDMEPEPNETVPESSNNEN